MDRLNTCFLNILRAALKGETLQEPLGLSQEEWGQLIRLAQVHHVLPLVLEAVHTLPEVKDAPFLPPLKRQVMQQVVVQATKTADFLQLNQQLRAAGIRPVVVKGLICRNLYPFPDHRISGDEDVLIPPEQTAVCHQVLSDFGMETVQPADPSDQAYEIPYRQKNGQMYIELHRYLFPPESEAYGDLNRFFAGAADRAVEVLIQGQQVAAMSPTDHLFYLICHAFKHFLHSGFGIRQVCDIVMYANHYGSQVDWDQVLTYCREIRADRFAAALLRIGQKYLTFDPQMACYPEIWQRIPVDETAMLEDLLSSGVFGNASMSRKHSSNITLDAVTAQKQGKKANNALLLSLFPSPKNLEGHYPYLKKYPWMVPAAWLHRIRKYRKESKSDHSNNASDALKIGTRRIALLKEYGIIE